MNIKTIRNIDARCVLSGQGLVEGKIYEIRKANIIENGEYTESAAWVRVNGNLEEIKNAHLAFDLASVA